MEAEKLFHVDQCIWELMTTPTNAGNILDAKSLQRKINALRKKWKRGEPRPTHYTYVFPINTVGNKAKKLLDEFKTQYSGLVVIKSYDCDQTQNFIEQISELNNIQTINEMAEYIQEARRKYFTKNK